MCNPQPICPVKEADRVPKRSPKCAGDVPIAHRVGVRLRKLTEKASLSRKALQLGPYMHQSYCDTVFHS